MVKLRLKLIIFFKACFIIGFIHFCTISFCQDQFKADSLILSLDLYEDANDSLRFEILRKILIYETNQNISLEYANEAYTIAQKARNPLWMFKITLEIGQIYKLKGDLRQALDFLFQSLKYAKKLEDKRHEAVVFTAIGGVYRVENNYSRALGYYNLGINKFREVNDSISLSTTLLNTGELYRIIHSLDTALIYFQESGLIFEKQKYKIGIAYNLGNIGLVYAEQGKNNLAEQNINEAIRILEELGDTYAIAVYDTYMADIYKNKGDYKRAIAYASRSHKEAIKGGFKEQIRDASLKLSELYSDLKDYEKAFNFQSEYLAYRDSINNEETIRKMADLRTEYEVSQKQAEVDLLNIQKRNQQIVGAGLIAVVLLAGALAFTFYRNNKEKQRINVVLQEQKEEIEAQRDQLDEMNKSKDKFFSIISHDLRGPVHAFKGMSRLIKMYIDYNSIEELAELNQHFDKSVDQLSTLLDDLLEWAVAQQGNMPYNPEKVSLNELSNDLIGLFSNMAQAKKIELQTELQGDVLLWVDSNSVRTILRNLINNALKFTPEGGSIILSGSIKQGMGVIKIKDTGIGISRDKLETLFKLAEHKISWGTDGEKGLGLGLQLVYEFSKMNGGNIAVESEEGIGTTFTLTVPLFRGSAEPAPSVV